MTRFLEWLFGIAGVIATACGAVILHSGDLRFVLGDYSWLVASNVESVWGYALVIGGAVVAVGMVVAGFLTRRYGAHHTQQTGTPHPAT